MRMTAFLAFLTVSSLVQADDWPQFRGPRGDGQSSATGLPVTWSESEHIRWKTAIHGKGWSSPVILNGQVWITTAPEDGKQLFAVCVAADSGKIVRDVRVFSIEKPAFCHTMNSYATPTPALEEGRVYVHFGSAGTACLDTQSGQVLWTRQDLPCDHFRGPASSPILYRDLLIVNFDGFDYQYVVALDKHSGRTVWKRDRDIDYRTPDGDGKKAYGTPQVVEANGRAQLVSPAAVATLAYDPLTGEELWRVRHGGMNSSARPLFGQGLIFINTGAGGDRLLAVRPGGRGDVTESHVAWKQAKTVPTRSSQLLIGDLIFMVDDAGVASCLEAKTGHPVWQHRLGGKYSASPVAADGRIYFFSEDGEMPVIAPAAEFKSLAVNRLDEGCMASPAIVGHALYVRTRTHLYRIEN